MRSLYGEKPSNFEGLAMWQIWDSFWPASICYSFSFMGTSMMLTVIRLELAQANARCMMVEMVKFMI